jgi:hypothetical protein
MFLNFSYIKIEDDETNEDNDTEQEARYMDLLLVFLVIDDESSDQYS